MPAVCGRGSTRAMLAALRPKKNLGQEIFETMLKLETPKPSGSHVTDAARIQSFVFSVPRARARMHTLLSRGDGWVQAPSNAPDTAQMRKDPRRTTAYTRLLTMEETPCRHAERRHRTTHTHTHTHTHTRSGCAVHGPDLKQHAMQSPCTAVARWAAAPPLLRVSATRCCTLLPRARPPHSSPPEGAAVPVLASRVPPPPGVASRAISPFPAEWWRAPQLLAICHLLLPRTPPVGVGVFSRQL